MQQLDIEDVLGPTQQRQAQATLVVNDRLILRAGDLANVATVVKDVIAKEKLPVLNHVLVTTGDGKVLLTVTNMEIWLTISIATDYIGVTQFVAPVNLLFGMAKQLNKDDSIEISVGANSITCASGTVRAVMAILPADEFPVARAPSGFDCKFDMPTAELKRALGRTVVAVNADDTKYHYMAGVHMRVDDKRNLTFVGIRPPFLSEYIHLLPMDVFGFVPITIPLRTVNVITAAMKSDAEVAKLESSSLLLRVTIGNLSVISKLIDGKSFPDYNKLVPKKVENPVFCAADVLLHATKMVGFFSDDKMAPVKVKIGHDTMYMFTPDGKGEATISNGDITYTGETIETSFSSELLIALLETMSGDMELHMKGDHALILDTGANHVRYVLSSYRI